MLSARSVVASNRNSAADRPLSVKRSSLAPGEIYRAARPRGRLGRGGVRRRHEFAHEVVRLPNLRRQGVPERPAERRPQLGIGGHGPGGRPRQKGEQHAGFGGDGGDVARPSVEERHLAEELAHPDASHRLASGRGCCGALRRSPPGRRRSRCRRCPRRRPRAPEPPCARVPAWCGRVEGRRSAGTRGSPAGPKAPPGGARGIGLKRFIVCISGLRTAGGRHALVAD